MSIRAVRRGILWDPEAWQDYLDWRAEAPENMEKINGFIKECLRTPFAGTGKPEPLKGQLQGYWSRRITREHRFVYRVDDIYLSRSEMRKSAGCRDATLRVSGLNNNGCKA